MNISNIGDHIVGRKQTEETKEKIKAKWTPERKEKQRLIWLGRKHSEETKEKMRNKARKADLVGKRFGRLTVVSLDRIENRHTVWLCKCDCGKENIVSISGLIGGTIQSCGCLKQEAMAEIGRRNTIGLGKAAANSILYGYKKSAGIRNLSWELSEDDFFSLIEKNCHYCGDAPSLFSHRSSSFNGGFVHNGIDRVDNTLGYTKENCVSCCKNCNYAKRSLSYSEFLDLVRKVYNNLWP